MTHKQGRVQRKSFPDATRRGTRQQAQRISPKQSHSRTKSGRNHQATNPGYASFHAPRALVLYEVEGICSKQMANKRAWSSTRVLPNGSPELVPPTLSTLVGTENIFRGSYLKLLFPETDPNECPETGKTYEISRGDREKTFSTASST